MSKSSTKTPINFWVISIIALFWNIMGVIAYLKQAYMTPETLALLSEDQQAWYTNVPAWVTAAFAIAVFSGTFGCFILLLRKKWATILFIISFIAVLVQSTYTFLIQNFVEITADKAIMPISIILIALLLVWFSNNSNKKGILS